MIRGAAIATEITSNGIKPFHHRTLQGNWLRSFEPLFRPGDLGNPRIEFVL